MIDLVVEQDGNVRMIYSEAIDIRRLGDPNIRRGSYVEPAGGGLWNTDLSPSGGPVLGPFQRRSEALASELEWLRGNWLRRQRHQ